MGTCGLGDLGTLGLWDFGTWGLEDLRTWGLGDLGTWGIGDLGTSCSSCWIEIIENGLKLLEIDMRIWGLPIGSGITRFPGLVWVNFTQNITRVCFKHYQNVFQDIPHYLINQKNVAKKK